MNEASITWDPIGLIVLAGLILGPPLSAFIGLSRVLPADDRPSLRLRIAIAGVVLLFTGFFFGGQVAHLLVREGVGWGWLRWVPPL